MKCNPDNNNKTYWCCESHLCNNGTGKMEEIKKDGNSKNEGSIIFAGLLSVVSVLAFLAI